MRGELHGALHPGHGVLPMRLSAVVQQQQMASHRWLLSVAQLLASRIQSGGVHGVLPTPLAQHRLRVQGAKC